MLNFENIHWRSNDLPPLSIVTYVIILCGTNNLCEDPTYQIIDGITATASAFEKKCNDPRTIVCGLIPRAESCSVN